MHEFDLIKRYFAPLSIGFPGSLNLRDDAAILGLPPGKELVVTTDAINEGVHFIGNENPSLIAKKLLRVNLSDLAAKGATPLCYFLSLSFPRRRESIPKKIDPRGKPKDGIEKWIKDFSKGLAEDQKLFGIHLAGGDTTATKGKKSFSLTALGTIHKGKALLRSGAKPGDHIYVSGTLGDSALGLALLNPPPLRGRVMQSVGWGENHPPSLPTLTLPLKGEGNHLINRYLLPEPRLLLGQKLHGIASSCMDISDGLVQDLGHICSASNVGATIHRHLIPLSSAAKKMNGAADIALSGGDDYELLFTAPAKKETAIKQLAKMLGLPLTRIGTIEKSNGVHVLDQAGKPLSLRETGYRHF